MTPRLPCANPSHANCYNHTSTRLCLCGGMSQEAVSIPSVGTDIFLSLCPQIEGTLPPCDQVSLVWASLAALPPPWSPPPVSDLRALWLTYVNPPLPRQP